MILENSKLNVEVYSSIKKYLGKDLYNDLIRYKPIVAGGAILSVIDGRKINDIDLYARSFDHIDDLVKLLDSHNYEIIFETNNAYTLKKKKGTKIIQIMKMWTFDELSDVSKVFDFDIVSNATYIDGCDNSEIYFHDIGAVMMKKAQIINLPYELPTLVRMKKYESRGYKFKPYEYLKVISRYLDVCKQNDNYSYKTFKDDLRVVDIYELHDDMIWDTWKEIEGLLGIKPITHDEFYSEVDNDQQPF